MHFSNFHYLPLAPGFFSILVGLFVILLVLLLIFRALRHAYLSLGVSSSTAMLLLFGSLIGSYFNIPVAELPNEQVVSNRVIEYFGMQYAVPVVEDWAGTVIAVNVGGAVIPTLMSLYLLGKRRLWLNGAIATAVVADRAALAGAPGARRRHRGAGFPSRPGDGYYRFIAVAGERRAARLYRRQHGHADRRRSYQSR